MNLVDRHNKRAIWKFIKKVDVIKRKEYATGNDFFGFFGATADMKYAVQIDFDISNIEYNTLLKALPSNFKKLSFNYEDNLAYLEGCKVIWYRRTKDIATIEICAEEAFILPRG